MGNLLDQIFSGLLLHKTKYRFQQQYHDGAGGMRRDSPEVSAYKRSKSFNARILICCFIIIKFINQNDRKLGGLFA